MNRWFVAHTRVRGEPVARRNLARQGFEVYLPRYLKRRRHARRLDRVAAPLFPRYVFIRMDPERCRWRSVNGTVGVAHLVCHGDRPAALPDGTVAEIRAREDARGLVAVRAAPPFRRGETVQVTAGPLSDQVGLFDCADDDERVVILLDLLGREVPVRVPVQAVRAYV